MGPSKYKVLFTLFCFFGADHCIADSVQTNGPPLKPKSRVIYGNDNRKDLYEVTNPLYRKLSDSTVAFFRPNVLVRKKDGDAFSIVSRSFKQTQNICASEPFADQPESAYCSGVLIWKNMILTASHCVYSEEQCASTQIAFGFDVNGLGAYPHSLPQTDVYNCKSIYHADWNPQGSDFALIILDRDVIGHQPIPVPDQSNFTIKTKLLMIGHPAGLPTKLDDGGIIRDDVASRDYFSATLDSYFGSSGSPVFDQMTGELKGILVRGEEEDFVQKGSCFVSKVCAESSCRGEEVTKITALSSFVPKKVQKSLGKR